MLTPLLLSGKIGNLTGQIAGTYKDIKAIIQDNALTLTAPNNTEFYYNTTTTNQIINILIIVPKKINATSLTKSSVTIDITNVLEYSFCVATKGDTSISKKMKKTNLDLISDLDKNKKYTLYSLLDTYLLTVDSSGFINMYLDTDTTYNCSTESVNKFLDTLGKSHISELPPLNTILTQCGYEVLPLDLGLDSQSYSSGMQELSIPTISVTPETPTNTALEPTSTPSPTTSPASPVHEEQSSGGIIGTIGYLASWLNPFSYYGSTIPSTTSTIPEHTQQLPQQLPQQLSRVESDLDISTAVIIESPNENTNTNTNINTNILYYVNGTSIIRVSPNGIFKVLDNKKLDIPIHIETITGTTSNTKTDSEIKLSGLLDNKYNVDICLDKQNMKNIKLITTHC